MAALDFPSSPTVGQVATLSNGMAYQWDGAVWATAASTGQAAGGDLSGTYPNPTVVKAAGNFSVPNGMVVMGPAVSKTRMLESGSGAWGGLAQNIVTSSGARDDVAKPGWEMLLRGDLDAFEVRRRSPADVFTVPLVVNAAGKTVCSLADNSVTNPMLGVGSAFRAYGGTTYRYPASTNISSTAAVIILRGTITTSGGMVLIEINSHGLFYPDITARQFADFEFWRDGGIIRTWICEAEIPNGSFTHAFPLSNQWFVSDQPAAGAHTYELSMRVSSASCIYRTGTYAVGDIRTMELA